jgi:hypothetical protein
LYVIQVVMTSWITSMFDSKECSQVTKVTHCPRGIYSRRQEDARESIKLHVTKAIGCERSKYKIDKDSQPHNCL